MLQPFEKCPQFESCSCNDCPLDPLAALHGGGRLSLPDDKRQECVATRATREAIAVACGYPVAWGWLAKEARRERARVRWLALPAEERQRRIDAGQIGRDALRKHRESVRSAGVAGNLS